jgi:alginate O-acetyltransferase complex protein AlgJ
MKRYPLKYLLFLSPFIIATFVELLLPVDFFTFRVWEALLPKGRVLPLWAPLYPNMHVRKTEQGDLGAYTPFAVFKDVEWYTDRYGCRKEDRKPGKFNIVIIGDSNTVGSGLTQQDMLSEMLEQRLKVAVYPMAAMGSQFDFLLGAIWDTPPDTIILASVERFIPELWEPKAWSFKPKGFFTKVFYALQTNNFLQSVAIQLDRIDKGNMFNFFRASIARIDAPLPKCVPIEDKCFLFLGGAKANTDVSEAKLRTSVNNIKKFHDIFHSMGIRFIFLPIPNKETIYYKYLHTQKPAFLDRLNVSLRELNIETIDTHKAFENAFEKNSVLLYHPDDTHWNKNGVRIAADILAQQLKSTRKDR